jgi:hypothetical protein
LGFCTPGSSEVKAETWRLGLGFLGPGGEGLDLKIEPELLNTAKRKVGIEPCALGRKTLLCPGCLDQGKEGALSHWNPHLLYHRDSGPRPCPPGAAVALHHTLGWGSAGHPYPRSEKPKGLVSLIWSIR